MQTTLLGLALALIAAILAAFAAPFFIDWNEWRPQLEAQASALAGTRVTIAGNIDLTLLPTPAFVLREISLGDADNGTGMRASEMRGSLSLTALLSGRFEASEFVLSRPAIRLVIERDGKLLLPAGAGAGQELSVSGFVFEAGSLTIEDRRTNSLLLADDFSARGELASREGPFRLDGGFRLHGMRWILRASSGRFTPEHQGRVRLVLERPVDNVSFEAEGLLTLADAAPRFEGKMIAARRSGALPWRIASDVAGDAAELRFANLELALGQGELPLTLSGDARLIPRANGALEVSLASKRIDLDLGDPKAPAAGAGHVVPWLVEVWELLAALPVPAGIAVSADGVLAGGQLVRDLRASLRAGNGTVALQRLEARLPGRAAIMLSGKHDGAAFAGPLSFESEEPQLFARWLLGEAASAGLPLGQTLRVKGDLIFAPRELVLRNLDAAIGAANVTGAIALRPSADSKSQFLEIRLATQGAELDPLLPLAKSFLAAGAEFDFAAELTGAGVRLLGKTAKQAGLSLARSGGVVSVRHLAVEDFDGLTLSAQAAAERGSEFTATIARSGGFATLLEYFSGSADFAAVASRYAATRFPLHLSGTLAPEQNGWRAAVKSGDAQFALALGELRDDRRPISASLQLPETEISAKGELRFGARFEPVLALNLKSADLRSAFVLAARASANVLPASGSANLARDGNRFVLDKLSFELAGMKGAGRIMIPVGEASPYSGRLALDRASAAVLVSLALGRAHRPDAALSVPPLSNFPGTLQMEIDALEISERLAVRKAGFELRAGRAEIVFDNLRGELAGGKISGALRIADTDPRVIELKLDVADAALAQLLATKSMRGALRGSLAVSASGNTQDSLIASLAGQGTISLAPFELDRTDATAVAVVFAATAKSAPDERQIEQALHAALERAPLKASKLEASLVIANGIIRSGSAKARALNTEIALSGSFNLLKRVFEAQLLIETAGASAARPGAVVSWRGPLDAPERKVDAGALITAITLRAIERGMQNPSKLNLPQEERVPSPPKKKRAPADTETDATPPLPPPVNILPAPQPRQMQN